MSKRADVARHAGVAESTVSNVLTGKRPVAGETRKRVLEAMVSLGYEPSYFARNIRSTSAKQIGVILPDLLANPFNVGVIAGIEAEATARGYVVMLGVVVRNFPAIAKALASRQVDAVIVADAPHSLEELSCFLEAGIPAVTLGFSTGGPAAAPSVRSDFRSGTRLAVEHLVGLGHTRIGLLPGGRPGDEDERLNGWLTELDRLGLRPRVVELGSYSYESAAAVAPAFFTGEVSAVLVASDLMASAVLDQAMACGISVPEQLSVVGYDDSMAHRMHPPLTTIRAHDRLMGGEACRVALEAASRKRRKLSTEATHSASGPAPLEHRVPVELVVRATTSSPLKG